MKKFFKFLMIIIIIGTLICLYARYIGTSGLVTYEYKIESSDIGNNFDGLKIVHFSDLHYLRLTNKDTLKSVIDEINLISPDIVFYTGDLVDMDFELNDNDEEDIINLLSNINSKYGKYAVIGNHDYYKDEEKLKNIYTSSDFLLLRNSYDIIYGNDNDKLFIGGVDTYSYDMANIDKTMEYFYDNEDISYKIILVHEPDYTDTVVNRYDVDLILSGHSHNGQINIPYIKNIFLPYGSEKYYGKYYKINNTDLYVSSGIGESRINFRLFNRPSINFYRINKITD